MCPVGVHRSHSVHPVAGTGTTLVADALFGRRTIGIELSARTAELARKRLAGQQNALQATGAHLDPADDTAATLPCPNAAETG
jgi:hypothetical protein